MNADVLKHPEGLARTDVASRGRLILCLFVSLLLFPCVSAEVAGSARTKLGIDPREQGQVVKKDLPDGSYYQYIPAHPKDPPRFLVLVHGTLGENEPALVVADRFIRRWLSFAEEKGLILIAPALDQKSFGGEAGPGGGYRGLFGRNIGADEFVNRIVDQYKSLSDKYDGRFYLYGHSAGGMFTSRYVVLHPDRICGAVISAGGSYAYPDPAIAWGDGMAPLRCKMRWPDSDKDNVIDIKPDPNGWVKAGGIPITIVVGSEDTDPRMYASRKSPAQKGITPIERARSWIQDMKNLCAKHQQPCRIRLVIVAKAGHSSQALTPAAIRAIGEAISFNSRRPASRPTTDATTGTRESK